MDLMNRLGAANGEYSASHDFTKFEDSPAGHYLAKAKSKLNAHNRRESRQIEQQWLKNLQTRSSSGSVIQTHMTGAF